MLKFMLWCLEHLYSRKEWAYLGDAKSAKTSSIKRMGIFR